MRSKHKQLNRALLDAVVMCDITKVRELLLQGAEVNARDQEHEETPIMLAVKFADATMIRLLLDAGAAVNAQDDLGRTPLFFASIPSEVFNALLEKGADLHAQDEEGNTILLKKVSESAPLSAVEVLVQRGDRSFELLAQPLDAKAAPSTWKAVVVVEMNKGTAIVSPVDETTLQ